MIDWPFVVSLNSLVNFFQFIHARCNSFDPIAFAHSLDFRCFHQATLRVPA